MKKTASIGLVLIFTLMITNSYSQNEINPDHKFRMSHDKSVLFGKDVIIKDEPEVSQYNSVICSAFNGWLYAYYIFNINHHIELILMRSKDNGLTWTQIRKSVDGSLGEIITTADIAASGTSENDIKVLFGKTFLDTIWGGSYTTITCMDGNTGTLIGEVLKEPVAQIYDLDIETDILNPASGLASNSVAVLYSKTGPKDSIIYRTSSNGGLSFDYRKPVATTTNHFRKVSLSYGKVPSWNSGRYFGVWEEIGGTGADIGHIYAAHSEPNYNSPFSYPICLDSLNPGWINQVRNPVVACQSGNSDNSNGNITEVILFEKVTQPSGDVDIVGMYNQQAASSVSFQPLIAVSTGNKEVQPDLCYNPSSSKFMLTYFSQTDQRLPFQTQDVNITSPNQWEIITQGYNDSLNIIAPYPKVQYSNSMNSGVFIWNSMHTNGNGVALFDAPYFFPTSIDDPLADTPNMKLFVYPNPAMSILNVTFTLEHTAKVMFRIWDIDGKQLIHYELSNCHQGFNKKEIDLKDLTTGTYILTLWSSIGCGQAKFIKL